jgi:lipopolysaccharide transport system permease protein
MTLQAVAIAPPEASVTRIRPSRGALALDLAEMWRFRDLLYFLSWRDVKVKYKQAALGFAWAVLVPVANMMVFGVIFFKMAKLDSGGIDPFAFSLAALVPWQYFANCLTQSSNSLVGQAGLLTKIYLPRVFLPLSVCLAGLVDFLIGFVVMLAMMLCIPSFPKPALTLFLVPILMLPALVASLGAGLGLAALNVKYRDVRYVLPFLVQMWMYASVVFSLTTIQNKWGAWGAFLYGLNPMAGVVEGTRWCLLRTALTAAAKAAASTAAQAAGTDPVAAAAAAVGPVFPWVLLAGGVPVALIMFALGLAYFKRVENQFADIV